MLKVSKRLKFKTLEINRRNKLFENSSKQLNYLNLECVEYNIKCNIKSNLLSLKNIIYICIRSNTHVQNCSYNLRLITLNYVFNDEHYVFAIFFCFDYAFVYSSQLFVVYIYM